MKTMFKNSVCLIFLTAFMSFQFNASAQGNTFYLKMKGQKQGEIKGDVTEKGKEGFMKVISFQHEITSPRDAATGMSTGKRQHKPIVITKEIDKATPLIFAALTSNESLPEVTLSFYRTTPKTGASELWYSVKLTDAAISSVKSSVNDKGQALEEISLTYQKIQWNYTNGGVTHEDTWSAKN